jgi:hypothetical protein
MGDPTRAPVAALASATAVGDPRTRRCACTCGQTGRSLCPRVSCRPRGPPSKHPFLAGKFNDLWRFDPGVPSWTRLPARGAAPSMRSRHAMACRDRYVYVFGGSNGSGNAPDPSLLVPLVLCLGALNRPNARSLPGGFLALRPFGA